MASSTRCPTADEMTWVSFSKKSFSFLNRVMPGALPRTLWRSLATLGFSAMIRVLDIGKSLVKMRLSGMGWPSGRFDEFDEVRPRELFDKAFDLKAEESGGDDWDRQPGCCDELVEADFLFPERLVDGSFLLAQPG